MQNLNEETNSELIEILEYSNDAELKNKAGLLLSENNPTNSELTYIMEYCPVDRSSRE
jgi:hypothetical protein